MIALEPELLSYGAFGLTIRTPLALPGLTAGGTGPEVRIEFGDVRPHFSGDAVELERLRTAEGDVRLCRGSDGDLLLDAGELAACHVSADGSTVTCATLDPSFPSFQRMLLDTVLGTAALCRGHEGLHAAAVLDTSDRLTAIVGHQGAGKSTLAAELLARGGTLFADDLLFLDGGLAHPGPALMNLPQAGHDLGRTLEHVGTERWVQVDRRPLDPRPLWLLVILERTGRALQISCRPDDSPAPLLVAALDSGAEPTRRQRRFETLAELAQEAHTLRLTAPPNAPPSALADVLSAAICELP